MSWGAGNDPSAHGILKGLASPTAALDVHDRLGSGHERSGSP